MTSPNPKREQVCRHNPRHQGPEGYVAWHEWAEGRIEKGWRQKKCKNCNLYMIWVKPTTKLKRRRGEDEIS